jgi:hypothetical protein
MESKFQIDFYLNGRARNDSGETIPPFGLCAISGPPALVEGVAHHPVDKPGTTFYEKFVVNGPIAVADGKYFDCQLGPFVLVAYGVETPGNDDSFGPTPDSFEPSKHYPECLRVCGKVDTKNKTMQAFLFPINQFIGKTSGGTCLQGDPTQVTIWAGEIGSESSTGIDVSGVMNSGVPHIADGVFVNCQKINGQWQLYPRRWGSTSPGVSAGLVVTGATTETANSSAWTQNDIGGVVWATCRIAYNPSGDGKLYAFYRTVTTDETGKLYQATGETRVTVSDLSGSGLVKVNSADAADYLEVQFRDHHVEASAQYTSGADLLVEVDTNDVSGDKVLRLFVDSSDISGYDATAQLVLASSSGTIVWFQYGTVKVKSGDTAGYLETQFTYSHAEGAPLYSSGADLQVQSDTIDVAGDKQIRLYVHPASITGWSGSGSQILLWTAGSVSMGAYGLVLVNSSDTPGYLEDQFRDHHVQASAQYTSNQDLLVEVDTNDVSGDKVLRLFVDASDIDSWSSSGQRVLGWETGGLTIFQRWAENPGSPTPLGTNDPNQETAQSDSWTCDGSTAVAFYVTRSAYNYAGDKKFYQFDRTVKVDKTGKIYSISAETRRIIDTPDACP